jgi:lauroyl/myristoyl acyltransferase
MSLQSLVAGPRFTRFTMSACRHMPSRAGHGLAWFLSGVISRTKPAVYWIVRANLGQVLGSSADDQILDEKIRQTFYFAIRNSYDTYHNLHRPPEQLRGLIDFPEEAQAVAQAILGSGKGAVLAGAHLGNFDLAMQALGTIVPRIMAISLPNPPAGFQIVNQIRSRGGLQIIPLSPAALRQGIRTLREGGVLALAGDRPVSDMEEPFPFFGRPARVPSGHIRLALKMSVPVVVMTCHFVAETQKHRAILEPPIDMIRTGDPDEEVRINQRRVLDRIEAAIRQWPGQWQIFVPVWPELVRGES